MTGVSLQRVVQTLDAGAVLLAEETELGENETAGELAERLMVIAGDAAASALERIADGTATFTPQDESKVTSCTKLSVADGLIDWARSADEIRNQIRAMNPWPLARTRLPNGKNLLVLNARVSKTVGGKPVPGEILEIQDGLRVATGDGVLELLTVKREGKGALAASEFCRGARLEVGMRLGEETEGAER